MCISGASIHINLQLNAAKLIHRQVKALILEDEIPQCLTQAHPPALTPGGSFCQVTISFFECLPSSNAPCSLGLLDHAAPSASKETRNFHNFYTCITLSRPKLHWNLIFTSKYFLDAPVTTPYPWPYPWPSPTVMFCFSNFPTHSSVSILTYFQFALYSYMCIYIFHKYILCIHVMLYMHKYICLEFLKNLIEMCMM